MADVVFTGSSLYDKIDAKKSIRACFISKEIPELIEQHIIVPATKYWTVLVE